MVLITKEEKEAIRAEFPKVHITRTMRQKSSRHRYYCEEAPQVMRCLYNIRNRRVVETHDGKGQGRRQKKDWKDTAHAAGAKRTRV